MSGRSTNMSKEDPISAGRAAYQRSRDSFLADPTNHQIYAEEAAKKDLWLQLVEARMSAGLTQEQMAKRLGVSQAQVARIEKRGYDAYTLTTLRRYVDALGQGFQLEVRVKQPESLAATPAL